MYVFLSIICFIYYQYTCLGFIIEWFKTKQKIPSPLCSNKDLFGCSNVANIFKDNCDFPETAT